MKNWTLFLLEFGLFILGLFSGAYVILEPHMEQNLITLLEDKTGMKASFEKAFFSPLGRVEGQGMVFSGSLPNGEALELRAEGFRLEPRENIFKELWQRQEAFKFEDLHYEVSLEGVQLTTSAKLGSAEAQGSMSLSQLNLKTVHLKLGEREGEVELKGLRLESALGDLELRSLSAELKDGLFVLSLDGATWGSKNALQLEGKRLQARVEVGPWLENPERLKGPQPWFEVLSRIQDISCSEWSLRGGGQNDGRLEDLRLSQLSEQQWDLAAKGFVQDQVLDLDMSIHKKALGGDEGIHQWSLQTQHTLPIYPESPIHLSLQVQDGGDRPFQVLIYDRFENRLECDASLKDGLWVGTWNAKGSRIKMPKKEWPSLSADFNGGFSYHMEKKSAVVLLDADHIRGGVGKTEAGRVSIELDIDIPKRSFHLKKLLAEEASLWSGKGSLKGSWGPWAVDTLDLKVDRFPLGNYSPKVAGDLSIQASMADARLTAKVFSSGLFPNKDPLQKMENFQVNAEIDQEKVLYQQAFVQHDHQNKIEVQARVKDLLSDPLKLRDGQVQVVRSQSQLFDLNLKGEVPVRLNIEGVDIHRFVIEDRLGRLRQLRGHAYIPFIRPSQLLIEAKGELDLGKMPPLGGTKVQGLVNISRAKWDKGWSLTNLDVDWTSSKIDVTPEAIFEELQVREVEGRLSGGNIHVDDFRAQVGRGGALSGKGSYDISERFFDLKLGAEALSYRTSDYQLTYDIPDFEIRGPTKALNMSGNMKVKSFLYQGDFSLLGEGGPLGQRLLIAPPESEMFRHRMVLDIASEGKMAIKNNMADLSFRSDDLQVRGQLGDLRWFGKLQTVAQDGNRIHLPYKWLDVSLGAESLMLKFNGEDRWDPRAHLQASTLVDGVQVKLNYDDHLSSLGRGGFKLSSTPAYSRQEILSLLGSGEEPKREIFQGSTGDEDVKEAGPNITLFKSKPRSGGTSPLSYRAGLSSGEDLFELRVNYRLTPSLGLELSQTATSSTFLGLRFSKEFEKLRDVFHGDSPIKNEKGPVLKVKWLTKGFPYWHDPRVKGLVHQALLKAEVLLREQRYQEAKDQMVSDIVDLLRNEGYQRAQFKIKAIKRESQLSARRGGQRFFAAEKIVVILDFDLGPRLSVRQVEVAGWPRGLPLPNHLWFRPGRQREHLYSKAELESLKDRLISIGVNHGYPDMALTELSLEAVMPPDPSLVFEADQEILSKLPRNEKLRGTQLHDLKIKVDRGRRYQVVQLKFDGLKRFNVDEISKHLSFTKGMLYQESNLSTFPEKVKDYYEGHGYFGTRVQLTQVLKSRKYQRVSVHMKVDEGRRWRMGEITFQGVRHSSEKDLRRILELHSGDMAFPRQLKKAILKISQLPHMVSVESEWGDPVSTPTGELRDLLVKVEEVRPWSMSTRLGYESDDGLQWALRLKRANLGGRGESLGLDANFSWKERYEVLRYTIPDVLYTGWEANALVAEQLKLISGDRIENRSWIGGLSLSNESEARSWGYDLIYKEDRNVQGRVPTSRLRSVFRKASQPLPMQPGRGWGYNIKNQAVAYMDRKRFAYIGDYRLSYGFKLGGSMMTPWLRLGHKWSLGKNFELPLSDRFFLGGTGSLRGFQEDELGGRSSKGGESLGSGGAELFYPIEDWMYGSVFYELGRVFDRSSFRSPGELGQSIGMGLLIRTPVGPIQGYFAHPMGEDRFGRFGLQLGTIF